MFGTSVTSAGNNLPQLQDSSSNNVSIRKSSDILIGTKTHINGSVVIQNFITGNESQDAFVSNHNLGTLNRPPNGIVFKKYHTFIA